MLDVSHCFLVTGLGLGLGFTSEVEIMEEAGQGAHPKTQRWRGPIKQRATGDCGEFAENAAKASEDNGRSRAAKASPDFEASEVLHSGPG